jgi:hypothetical protein
MKSTTPADRQLRALNEAGNYTLTPDGLNRGSYLVENGKGGLYVTSAKRCTCPDHQRREVTCKHMILVQWEEAACAPSPADQAAVARYEALEVLPVPALIPAAVLATHASRPTREEMARRRAQDWPND